MSTTTGSDWLQRLESKWPVLALGYRYEVQLGKMLDEKRITGQSLRPYLRNVDVQWGQVNTADLPQMDFCLDDRAKYSLRPGDILVCEGGEVGRAALWAGDAGDEVYFQKALHRLRPLCAAEESPRFMFYALRAAAELNAYGDGGKATIAHLPAEAFRRVRFPRPPKASQERIANFLDEQTARIDALIAEKERLAERLAELEHAFGDELFRRRASERGTVRLKYRSPQITVGIVVTPAKYYVDAGVPSLRSLNVGQGVLNSDSLVFISPEANELHAKSKIFEGDVVVVRSGKPGAAAVVTNEFDGCNCIDLVIIRRSPQLNSDWLRAYLNSAPALEQVTDASEGAIQQHFNVSSARELRIPNSPPAEQALDLAAMNERQRSVRMLVAHAITHSDRLREYRSSLISAAVTGQLDLSTFKEAA